ncbi:hypothetical protein [Pelagicoccus enzymogenes]|nr:hypothetical protein [Pelagicoccus enzymogenes]
MHCLEDGAWLPVYEVRGNFPYCFIGDGLLKSSSDRVTMLSSKAFADGYLEVEILENTRSGVVQSDGVPRFTANAGWFQFTARVTAMDDVSDAYFVMRYDKLGEAAFSCRSIGDMKAGQSKVITLFKKLQYEMPEQLHFYTGMEEIRTNLVPSSYTYRFGDFYLEPTAEQVPPDMVASLH